MMLERVTKGRVKKPHLVLIWGVPGVGKSSWAAQAPNPIFLGAEEGTNNLDVARFPPPKNWKDIETAIDELIKSKHDYKTLVIDSIDWIEPLLHADICARTGAKSIESAAGGYGKGFSEAAIEWEKFIKSLSRLRDERGMNIILIGHGEIVKFSDPTTQTEYDRHKIKIGKKAAALFTEYVDCLFFANFEIYMQKDGNKQKHFGDGARVLYTERRPGFDAKNRMGLPFQIPLSWDDFIAAIPDKKAPEAIVSAINGMLLELKDDELKSKVKDAVQKAGGNVPQLEAILNRLTVRLAQ